ncbi:MAG: BrnT family toxin [Synergistaceae bacterium]|nr:BrnT family toxin [Synergistaceae bacterium]MBQ7067977.1 BrnT family toxin [Synergistaceae bacterium]MBR0075291.1 BrnT family toxin [Synergistaceae bacterium]MBR0232802.1 BrnT family toxin [Synergistaceae bacterium]MBR0254037.1 BrnT family toxin [Synergistaceae bacterium]
MQFEWDENKRKINIEKHGIDFADAVKIFDGFITSKQDTRADYGEERYVTIGLLSGIEIAVINTPRGNKVRIISVRRARDSERKKYYEEAKKHGYRF